MPTPRPPWPLHLSLSHPRQSWQEPGQHQELLWPRPLQSERQHRPVHLKSNWGSPQQPPCWEPGSTILFPASHVSRLATVPMVTAVQWTSWATLHGCFNHVSSLSPKE